MNCLEKPATSRLKQKATAVKSKINRDKSPNLYFRGQFSEFFVREYTEADTQTLCSWVTSAKALKTVSGDSGECLTPKILRSWVDSSIKSLVICLKDSVDPLGFCTLSYREIPELPHLNLEICHLLVKPSRNYFTIGHLLCMQAKSDAFLLGYEYLWGRVVPWNRFGKCLAEMELSKECLTTPAWIPRGFHWYMREISQSILEPVVKQRCP